MDTLLYSVLYLIPGVLMGQDYLACILWNHFQSVDISIGTGLNLLLIISTGI